MAASLGEKVNYTALRTREKEIHLSLGSHKNIFQSLVRYKTVADLYPPIWGVHEIGYCE